MDKAIYEIISEALVDGALPENFSLPRGSNKGVGFADGARDGIAVYHRAPGHELSDEQQNLIECAVDEISEGAFYDAEETVWRIADGIGPLDAHAALREYILKHCDSLSLDNLFDFATTLAIHSPDRRVVKIMLSILSVFRPGDEVKGFIRTLGLSDEFTLFAAMAMNGWDDTNDEWFQLAQKVRGWGRIHLVARLRPETADIRRWLLREGVHNTVMPEYSALNCWEKADVPSVLAGGVSREDFSGIRDIVGALLSEGPVAGISGVENAEAHILAFLNKAKDYALDDADRAVIAAVRDHFDDCPGIVSACGALL